MQTLEPPLLSEMEMEPEPTKRLRRPLVLSVPPEIFDIFSDYIDDEDDFLALRMVCQDFNAKFREAHLKCIYGVRRLFYALESFENLLKISRHPSGMNKYVRQIDICWSTPYYHFIGGDQFVNEVEANANGEFDEIRDMVLAITNLAGQKADEVLKLQLSDEEITFFSLALTGFPHLRTINVEQAIFEMKPFSRSEFNLLFPGVGMAPGKHLHHLLKHNRLKSSFFHGTRLMEDEPSNGFFWKLPIHSLLASGVTHLQTLAFNNSTGLQSDAFDLSAYSLPQFKATFANLKSLKFYMGGFNSGSDDDQRINATFGGWLETIGSNLEELLLESKRFYHWNRAVVLPVNIGLPRLKKLTLDHFVGSTSNLGQFLNTCKSQLQYLVILNTMFESPEVSEWYMLLQYLKENCIRLQEMELRPSVLEFIEIQYRNDIVTGILPSFLAKVTKNSIFDECDWTVVYPSVKPGVVVEERRRINDAIGRFSNAEDFWDSVTEGKWRSQEFLRDLLQSDQTS
ncbi:hypothetical protein TWF225_006869 [Orbilia oligospora]|uniref:Uncharacterized protein n=1 Tax=Orbilia oligospora TaxID=2813651 RepID=A0A7C8PW68_ORBOL|nr:hypothetical protein TWF751_008394 [Orbilia oligospora]KAF3194319.1 hypothetical protein TWF225_006869 [Orbilia oligospora]KAF3233885.1 hypothetical protein TWF128_002845 [Orbilia oligospora]KAF3264070.1 hypothetical protein TWF217_003230 [Orbilia oligospora]KAF3296180.1 hypothetical protein TWF132_011641 [Orbilia oligospora]